MTTEKCTFTIRIDTLLNHAKPNVFYPMNVSWPFSKHSSNVSLVHSNIVSQSRPRCSALSKNKFLARSTRATDWSSLGRLAPLATPETMSEASNSNPPSPLPACHRPMMRRTPKIPGNLSSAADDLKSNLHFAMLTAKNYYLQQGSVVSSNSNSEASFESAKGLVQAQHHGHQPPPVPMRRDSVLVNRWVGDSWFFFVQARGWDTAIVVFYSNSSDIQL